MEGISRSSRALEVKMMGRVAPAALPNHCPRIPQVSDLSTGSRPEPARRSRAAAAAAAGSSSLLSLPNSKRLLLLASSHSPNMVLDRRRAPDLSETSEPDGNNNTNNRNNNNNDDDDNIYSIDFVCNFAGLEVQSETRRLLEEESEQVGEPPEGDSHKVESNGPDPGRDQFRQIGSLLRQLSEAFER